MPGPRPPAGAAHIRKAGRDSCEGPASASPLSPESPLASLAAPGGRISPPCEPSREREMIEPISLAGIQRGIRVLEDGLNIAGNGPALLFFHGLSIDQDTPRCWATGAPRRIRARVVLPQPDSRPAPGHPLSEFGGRPRGPHGGPSCPGRSPQPEGPAMFFNSRTEAGDSFIFTQGQKIFNYVFFAKAKGAIHELPLRNRFQYQQPERDQPVALKKPKSISPRR